jgi:glycosyltransferase involved in cell wall biosynthesis
MACNLPIISVDVGDVAEVIRDTESCYICPRNPEAIAVKLAQVLRLRKRTNGHMAAAKFDLSKVAADIATIYQGLF